MRVLRRLGLAETIREHGGVLEQARWLTPEGTLIKEFHLPETGEPAIALHRAELQRALLNALPDDSIHLGHTCETYEQLPDRIVAHFANQSSFESDLLIAADGVHSRTRAQLLNDGPPDNQGYFAWRGVVPYTPSSVPAATAIEIYGPGQRFGIGPLGFGKIGWWASTNAPNNATDAAKTREQLLRLFDGWCEPVKELIEATPLDSLIRNDVCDRRPRRGWISGAVTLLGDAIHPTTPNLGQGGCLAIEDAAVLARCLDKSGAGTRAQISAALHNFERLRYRRTAAIARYSRVYGRIGQWERPWAAQLRRCAQSLVHKRLIKYFLRAVFDYDAYAVRI
jgi:2-polyprenyl-6-methoxyphenol hydroxylase-like FAD-dependent oxidoreductase